MFSRVNLNEENVSTYVRFSEIKVSNPLNGEPTILVTIDTVLEGVGVIKSKVVALDKSEPIKGIGFDGKGTTIEYSAVDVMLMVNSLCHKAMNQKDVVYEATTVDLGGRTFP